MVFSISFICRAVAVVVGMLCAPFVVLAQNGNEQSLGAKIEPAFIEERLDPGDTHAGRVLVTNTSAIEQTFAVLVQNVSHVDLSGRPIFDETVDDTGLTLASWVSTTKREVTLAPGASESVEYFISVPQNAPPGGHFGGLFVYRKADAVSSSGAGVGYQIGTLMNIQVNGEIIPGLSIVEFSSHRPFTTKPFMSFKTIVENSGNVLERPRGVITIKNMFGKTVATLTVNDTQGGVVPRSKKQFDNEWSAERLFFGRFQAVLAISYGQEARYTVTRTLTYWVVPIKEISVALGALMTVLLLLYAWTRFYIRRQLRNAGYHPSRSGGMTFMQTLLLVLIILLVVVLGLFAMFFVFFA